MTVPRRDPDGPSTSGSPAVIWPEIKGQARKVIMTHGPDPNCWVEYKNVENGTEIPVNR